MAPVLTLHTDYEDITALAEGFVDRVEQDTMILYGPERFDSDQHLEFVILLADGSSALEGKCQVRASVDGGDERPAEQRYDVIVDRLSFEGRNAAIFERMLLQKSGSSVHPGADDKERETTQRNALISEDTNRASERPSQAPGKKAKGGKRNSVPPDESSNGHSMLNGGGRVSRYTDRPIEPHIAAPDAALPPSDLDEPAPFVLTKEENSSLSRPRYPRLERAVDSLIPKAENANSGKFQYENGLPSADRPPLPGLNRASGSDDYASQSDAEFDDFNSK